MNNTEPPTEVVLESLYSQFIRHLKDYKQSTSSDWRTSILDDLKEIYNEVLTYADVENVELNPYYKLITHRSLNEHIILAQRRHNIV